MKFLNTKSTSESRKLKRDFFFFFEKEGQTGLLIPKPRVFLKYLNITYLNATYSYTYIPNKENFACEIKIITSKLQTETFSDVFQSGSKIPICILVKWRPQPQDFFLSG